MPTIPHQVKAFLGANNESSGVDNFPARQKHASVFAPFWRSPLGPAAAAGEPSLTAPIFRAP
jgi:hypothetical protein